MLFKSIKKMWIHAIFLFSKFYIFPSSKDTHNQSKTKPHGSAGNTMSNICACRGYTWLCIMKIKRFNRTSCISFQCILCTNNLLDNIFEILTRCKDCFPKFPSVCMSGYIESLHYSITLQTIAVIRKMLIMYLIYFFGVTVFWMQILRFIKKWKIITYICFVNVLYLYFVNLNTQWQKRHIFSIVDCESGKNCYVSYDEIRDTF